MKKNTILYIFGYLYIVFLLVGAHYFFFGSFGSHVWDLTYSFGMDTAFTPFTADMFGAGGETNVFSSFTTRANDSFYQYPLSLEVFTKQNSYIYEISPLSFYQFKLPLLAYAQGTHHGYVQPFHSRALCVYLQKIHKHEDLDEPTSFVVRTPVDGAQSTGLNIEVDCSEI